MSDARIVGGIEWYIIDRGDGHPDEDCKCARCGSSCEYVRCPNCGGEGYSHHDCGEDCCACLYADDNVTCEWCGGDGGAMHCLSTPEWCQGHPIPGREHIQSTALSSEAWSDVA